MWLRKYQKTSPQEYFTIGDINILNEMNVSTKPWEDELDQEPK